MVDYFTNKMDFTTVIVTNISSNDSKTFGNEEDNNVTEMTFLVVMTTFPLILVQVGHG